MKQEVSIKESTRAVFALIPGLMIFSDSYYRTNDSFYLYSLIIVTVLIIYFYFKDKNKTKLLCSFTEDVIYFPTIGRQLKVNEIDKIDILKSQITFSYIIKIYSNAYEDDILKLRVPSRHGVTSMLKLFKEIEVDESIVETKI